MWWVLFKELEEKRDRQDGDKLELAEVRHQLEAEYKEHLRRDHAELAARHEQFSAEHASAVERSRLYDQDMLDKARRIKDQAIEMKTLENLLHEKTKEMSDQLSDIDLKEKELAKAKERINTFEDVISA